MLHTVTNFTGITDGRCLHCPGSLACLTGTATYEQGSYAAVIVRFPHMERGYQVEVLSFEFDNVNRQECPLAVAGVAAITEYINKRC